jgi:hypothetical protein
MILSKKLTRTFDVRGVLIECPMQDAPLSEAVRALAKTNPLFRQTRIYEEDGEVVGDKLVYKLQLPPPKSKG